MSIRTFLQKAITRNEQRPFSVDAKQVFKIVYGRAPSYSELDFLSGLSSLSQKGDWTGLFRAIVGGYDHQWLKTPFTIRFSKEDIEYISIYGVEVSTDRVDISVSLPLQREEYESHVVRFYRDCLKPGMTFVDVGANIGVYSLIAAKLVGTSGKVFCFEPNSENCRLIMLSAFRNNFQNVFVYPFALADKTGSGFFSTHIGSNGGLISDTPESLSNPSCVVVPTLRLDDVINFKVDCIKIDVEGAEGLVSQGAMRLIETWHPMITSEFSMEMLPRVSGISGKEYLKFYVDNHYDIFLIDRHSQELIPIHDIYSFIDGYGEPTRIEDLAFIPH